LESTQRYRIHVHPNNPNHDGHNLETTNQRRTIKHGREQNITPQTAAIHPMIGPELFDHNASNQEWCKDNICPW